MSLNREENLLAPVAEREDGASKVYGKFYQAPRLIDHGSVQHLTQGSRGGSVDGQGNQGGLSGN